MPWGGLLRDIRCFFVEDASRLLQASALRMTIIPTLVSGASAPGHRRPASLSGGRVVAACCVATPMAFAGESRGSRLAKALRRRAEASCGGSPSAIITVSPPRCCPHTSPFGDGASGCPVPARSLFRVMATAASVAARILLLGDRWRRHFPLAAMLAACWLRLRQSGSPTKASFAACLIRRSRTFNEPSTRLAASAAGGTTNAYTPGARARRDMMRLLPSMKIA